MPTLPHSRAHHPHRTRLLSLAALFGILLALPALAQNPPTIVNVGRSSDDMTRVDGHRAAFVTHESQERTDFNNDGDTNDRVVQLYDLDTATITDTGLAQAFVMSAADLHLRGDVLAFLVYEPAERRDLNGAGGVSDLTFVPHVRDLATGETANLGLEGRFPALGEGFLAFLVREPLQLADLNGDGDQLDSVAHVYDTASKVIHNLGLPATSFAVGSSMAVFLVRESPGNDLNGDGDVADAVAHAYDATTGQMHNLGLAVLAASIAGRFVGLYVDEAAQGADLNGDGDMVDRVLHLYDGDTGSIVNTGLWVESLVMTERLAAFTVVEFFHGADLNGDGDLSDRVLHVFNRATGTTANLGLDPTFSIAAAGTLVAFRASESANGNSDFNGDGDAGDSVLHLHDAASGTTSNLRFAIASPLDMDERLIVAQVSEAQQGNTDLNGDGDAADQILHAFKTADGSAVNLGHTPIGQSRVVNARVAFNARETDAGTDLNGDGDTADVVVHLYDGVQGEIHNLRLAVPQFWALAIGKDLLAFTVLEQNQGRTDLNGDGDIGDHVLHVVRLSEPTPGERLQDLIDMVIGLDLHHGIENALMAKLEAAMAALAAGDTSGAVSAIGAFVNQVNAQAGKKITEQAAQELIARAEEIQALLAAA
ncbi:MAG: hypothetical protein R3357_07865 [Burkholderiales bacterium]|nr:hypothetical protein [Burkholderiales bacterium]